MNIRKTGFLLGGVATFAFAGAPAFADALTVSSATTAQLTTASAANSSAGDITIDSNGSVITAAAPAITINSSNSLSNAGTIQSSATTGATAVLIDGTSPITTSFTNNAIIGVTGTGGSGNIGLRIAGGPISGTIASGLSSAISASGTGAIGVSIESAFTGNITLNTVSVAENGSTAISLTAPLTGTLKLTGTNGATASGGYAALLAGDISGGVINGGSLINGAASTTITASDGTTSTGPAVGGPAALWIQGNVGSGFVNDRYYLDSNGALVATASATSSDTLYTGSITGYAGSTAVLIRPSSIPENITLSSVGAAGTADAYGFVNRGAITTVGSLTGTAGTAISIGGATIGGTLYGVTIQNGLDNQSTGTITATATDGAATAISIGSAAVVPAIVNAGAIAATASTLSTGANAYAIDIGAGAQVQTITNSGTIGASSSGSGSSAYGIIDRAGTVTSIVNSGSINANGSTGNSARAIDLSAGALAQTVTNSGKITGDIVFGAGNDSYISNSGTLSGALSFGTGSNLIQLSGASTFANGISLATGGTLAVAVGGTSSFAVSGSAPTLSSLSMTDASQLILGVSGTSAALTVSGAASFTGTSSIKLVVSQNLPSTAITVLTAGGGITTDHLSTLLSGTSTPYLYSLDNYSIANNALTLTLHQKSASEIGFVSGVAPIYAQSLAAFGSRASFQAIASLPDQATMLAAYRQILPPSYGSFPIRLAQSMQSAGMGTIAARLDAILDLPSDVAEGYRLGPWIQQNMTFLKHADSQDDPGFRSSGYGISFGSDYALSGTLMVGAAANFAWNTMHITGDRATDSKPFTVNSQMADVYAGWHSGPFFVQAIGSYGHNSYDFQRDLSIGTVTATQVAKWSGDQYGGQINAGVKLRLGNFILQPSNAFSYIKLHQGSYTETGGGDFNLAVEAKDDTATLNTTRLSAGYAMKMLGGTLTASARGAYIAQLDKTIAPLNASFLSGGTSFALSSAPLKGSETQEGLSVGYHQEGFDIALSADRRQETSFNELATAVTVRLNF